MITRNIWWLSATSRFPMQVQTGPPLGFSFKSWQSDSKKKKWSLHLWAMVFMRKYVRTNMIWTNPLFRTLLPIGGPYPCLSNTFINEWTDWCPFSNIISRTYIPCSIYGYNPGSCRGFTKRHTGYVVNLNASLRMALRCCGMLHPTACITTAGRVYTTISFWHTLREQ